MDQESEYEVFLFLISIILCGFSDVRFCSQPMTRDCNQEKWKLLFDGKTGRGWRNVKNASFPEKGWVIDNGELTVVKSGRGGDIILW